eukprot:GFUD01108938.1.p1 GENE.GFUD01108938.1~~GFUD01108938.1.p1  ORF type:complete len:132 (+),score=54.65 GFUD01108938.1:35-430(+)
MLIFTLSLLLITFSETSAIDKETEILSEIETANEETQSLADDLTDLLTKIEKDGDDFLADENLYNEIVDKIQQLAEATEEENLIKLTETVKNSRIEEEQLQNSVENLQRLAERHENGEQIADILKIATTET